MKEHKKTILIIFLFFFSTLFYMIILSTNHQQKILEVSENKLVAATYKALAPIEGVTSNDEEVKTIEEYLPVLFNWGIAIAVILAILMTIYGGIKYMTTDAFTNKKDGKKIIQQAIVGLLLALSAWLILEQINPQILKPNTLTPKLNSSTPGVPSGSNNTNNPPDPFHQYPTL